MGHLCSDRPLVVPLNSGGLRPLGRAARARPPIDPGGIRSESTSDGRVRLTAGVRIGPYEITDFLGAGGMGEVYRAHDTNLDRVVALKLLPSELAADPERVRRFEEEARAASALSHRAIVTIYDAGQIGLRARSGAGLVANLEEREWIA